MNFKNKTALITGAASGMGFLFAKTFAKKNGNVLLTDINEQALIEKVDEINALGKGKATFAVCDVRDYKEVCAARDTAVSAFGRIDILVNFAGGTATRIKQINKEECPEFPDVPIEVFDFGIDLNLKGPFYFAHAVLGQMREQGSGFILNIGSVTGAEGAPYGMDYSTSKAGVMYGLTKSIAQFGSPHNIRCNCVSPGPVLTRRAMSKMRTLLNRAASPKELIDFCLFLCTDKAEFINGENIMMDGGRNAMGRWTYHDGDDI